MANPERLLELLARQAQILEKITHTVEQMEATLKGESNESI